MSVAVFHDSLKSPVMFQEDNAVNIAPLPHSIACEAKAFTESCIEDDYRAYFTTFGKELDLIVAMEGMVKRGYDHIHLIYTYRSVSQAIPEIAIDKKDLPTSSNQNNNNHTERESLTSNTSFLTQDDDLEPQERAELAVRKAEINGKIVEVLRKEMAKIKDLLFYIQDAVTLFHNFILQASKSQKEQIIPEGLLLAALQLLDVLIILDTLKEYKTCILKDFSRYKRVLGTNQGIEVMEEIHLLQNFLAGQDARKARHFIFTSLRDSIRRVGDHESILLEFIDFTVTALEDVLYILPNEKFRFLRVLPHLLAIADGERDENNLKVNNIFKNSKVKLSLIQKLIRKNPVVPLFADISMTLEYTMHLAPHYEKSWTPQWSIDTSDSKTTAQYQVESFWESIRDSYSQYMTNLLTTKNRLLARIAAEERERPKIDGGLLDKDSAKNIDLETAHAVYDMVMEGLQKLSKWVMIFKMMLAWKYTHPVSEETMKSNMQESAAFAAMATSNEGLEYARVLKYNFSQQELSVIVDIVSMIKSMASQFGAMEALLAPYVRAHIHHRVQQLVQDDLTPLLHRVDKRNKPILPTLLKIRSLAADWANGVEPANDYKEYSRNKQQPGNNNPHKTRVVATSTSQLFILRTQIAALCESKSEVRRRSSIFFGKADLEKTDAVIFENFLVESFTFPYALQFGTHVKELSLSLSDFWYREFFLEMSKCVQFPIDMSLPWILIEHCLNHAKVNPILLEKVFYLLDLYDDAASMALVDFHQQFLYDEIEAETNLVIDQLYFLLSDEVYNYYKDLAASQVLDAAYKMRLEETKGRELFDVPPTRFAHILQQKTMCLLGRTINISFIFVQNITTKFHRDIDIAIKRFESGPVSGLMDLTTLLKVLEQTHRLLSQYLPTLDNFEMMLQEVDESLSPTSYRGRVSLHILNSIARDLLPNYVYNGFTGRFIKAVIAVRPMEYPKAPKQALIQQAFGSRFYKAFDSSGKLTRDFIGRPHYEVLVNLLVNKSILINLNMILDQLLKNLFDKIVDISEYLEALKDGIPPCKPPQPIFRSVGAYGYFEGKLRAILSYDDLKPEVFQTFREIGNTIAFFKELSQAMEIKNYFDFLALHSFFGSAAVPSFGTSSSSGTSLHIDTSNDSNLDEVIRSTPLMRIVSQTQHEIAMNKDLKAVVCRSDDVVQRVPLLLQRQMESAYNSVISMKESRSLIKWVLVQVEEFLYQQSLTTDWSAFAEENGIHQNPYFVVDIDNTKGFVKLWAALNFLFCINDDEEESEAETPGEEQDGEEEIVGKITNASEFGHGFTIAGCMFMHLLAQRPLFELIDFSSQVIRMFEYEEAIGESILETSTGTGAGAGTSNKGGNAMLNNVDPSLLRETKAFLVEASFQQRLRTQWFPFFENIHQSRPSYVKHATNKTIYHPPAVHTK
jgi:cytoplasmic FMR1 interacting protein